MSHICASIGVLCIIQPVFISYFNFDEDKIIGGDLICFDAYVYFTSVVQRCFHHIDLSGAHFHPAQEKAH